jgi:hypothetical protein
MHHASCFMHHDSGCMHHAHMHTCIPREKIWATDKIVGARLKAVGPFPCCLAPRNSPGIQTHADRQNTCRERERERERLTQRYRDKDRDRDRNRGENRGRGRDRDRGRHRERDKGRLRANTKFKRGDAHTAGNQIHATAHIGTKPAVGNCVRAATV